MPSTRKKSSSARVLSERKIFQGAVFTVVSQQVQEPDGVRVRRDIVQHPGSIVILALDDADRPPRVLLERQYRHAAGMRLWGTAGGYSGARGGQACGCETRIAGRDRLYG
ncbi:MAG: hypothetical protein ACRD4I_17030 [Candidatus Angelobacter sp.]